MRNSVLLVVTLAAVIPAVAADPPAGWAEVRVVDAATGRGVPLVTLTTVHHVAFVTDSAGRVAISDPDLLGTAVHFTVSGHGYAVPKDGFGFAGVRVTPTAGKPAVIKVNRTQPAERLCRLTGEGRYRDSVLLGHPPPAADGKHPGRVAGQDSVQAAVYRGKVHYLWGDTLRLNYPLGLYRTAGATTPLPDATADPAAGFAYDYFTDPATGFARAMMPLAARPDGVVWVFGVGVVPDDKGADRLFGHYSRRKGLHTEYEQGVALFDDATQAFEPATQLPLTETWRRPAGHPLRFNEGGKEWLYFGNPTPNVRVPAALADVLNPASYEAFTCVNDAGDGPDVDAAGRPNWRWQKARPPTTSKVERGWVRSGKLTPAVARFCPADAATPADRVELHSGSVRWNDHRKRWVLVAGHPVRDLRGATPARAMLFSGHRDVTPFLSAWPGSAGPSMCFVRLVCHRDCRDRPP